MLATAVRFVFAASFALGSGRCARLIVLWAAAIAAVSLTEGRPASASPDTDGPPGSAFYSPPSPLPAAAPGEVIWARPLRGGPLVPGAATNTLVLYHTVAPDGRDVAVSGAIAIPKGVPPAGGWPVISWAHGTTGNAPQCAPTRAGTVTGEQAYLSGWLARGYAIVQTDYEGQGTPGLHPYLVGSAAAHDVTDIVRAARELYPAVGTHWFVFGHSEGGSAALFTAMVAPGWAPELTLQGSVSFAPATHIAALIYSLNRMTEPMRNLPLILEMIEGVASSDHAISLEKLLTPQALSRLPDIQKRCTDSLMQDADWTALPPSSIFAPGANTRPLVMDFLRNDANRVIAHVPILLLQGDADRVVSPLMTTLTDKELCSNGNAVFYVTVKGKTHETIVTDSLAITRRWVDGIDAGVGALSSGNCDEVPGDAPPRSR